MSRLRAVLAMRADLPDRLFTPAVRERLAGLVDIDWGRCLDDARAPSLLADADLLLTGWECPRIDGGMLERAPRLRAVVHTGGSVKGHLDPACWERGIAVSTAAEVNAVPVAEYAVAMILLAGKAAYPLARRYRERRSGLDLVREFPGTGNYGCRVGIVGASRIGRRVIDLLRPFDLDIGVYDPYTGDRDLDDLLRWADVVSLHAPALPETRHLIDARRLALMRDGATLVNTARGGLVDHDALLAELRTGRLSAVLDVTEPEVPPADSPLYALPNVLLTPHLAGSLGNELHRLGAWAADEVERFVRGEPFAAPVRREDLTRIA